MDVKKLIHDRIRSQDKALSTAEQYTHWTTRYLEFCKARKIGKETKAETAVERFLSDLANVKNVSAKTQNQAFSALCYFYKECLKRPLVDVSALRAKNGSTVREVVDQSEIVAIFQELSGIPLLCARMMYVSRQIKAAVERAGIDKRITSHCLRHSFATHSLESGVPIHVIQALMGHTSIETTQTYLHASKDGATAAKSPIETLERKPVEKAPLAEMLRNPKPASQSAANQPRLRVFAG